MTMLPPTWVESWASHSSRNGRLPQDRQTARLVALTGLTPRPRRRGPPRPVGAEIDFTLRLLGLKRAEPSSLGVGATARLMATSPRSTNSARRRSTVRRSIRT